MTQTGTRVITNWNMYPYRISAASSFGLVLEWDVGASLWFGWVSLVLILVGGALGIAGGIRRRRGILLTGGAFAIFAIVVFAVGLLIELPRMNFMAESPKALFYFGNYVTSPFYHSIYLSFGYWLALVSGILMLFASAMRIRMVDTGQQSTSTQPLPSILRKYCTVCGAKLDAEDAYCRKCRAAMPS